VWDDADRPVEEGHAWSLSPGWIDTRRVDDQDGRIRAEVVESDGVGDGTPEMVRVTEWSWTCG